MDDIAVARAIHVFAVVVWIGGVAMVTTVILPIVRRGEKERLALLEAVEGRFIWQARIASLLVAASGFYMKTIHNSTIACIHQNSMVRKRSQRSSRPNFDPFCWRAADQTAKGSLCAGST
jgi:uncharacterized membrane protein